MNTKDSRMLLCPKSSNQSFLIHAYQGCGTVAEPSDFEMQKSWYRAYVGWKHAETSTYEEFIESLPNVGIYILNKNEFQKYDARMRKIRADRVVRALKESKEPREAIAKVRKVGKSKAKTKSENSPQLGTPDQGTKKEKPPTKTPIVVAVMICLFLVYGNSGGPFEPLGMALISITIGCHLAAIMWLELATMPRFRKSQGLTWSFEPWAWLLALSFAASLAMLLCRYWAPATSSGMPYASLINPDSSFSFHPLLTNFLIFQIVSHIFLYISMKEATTPPRSKAASRKFIRSPWSISSMAALVSLSFLLGLPGPVGDTIELPGPSIFQPSREPPPSLPS